MATEELAQRSPFSVLCVSWLTLSWPYNRLYDSQCHGIVSLSILRSELLAHEHLGKTLIDRSPGLPLACFSAFAQGDPHKRFPSLLFFAFVENLISSFKPQYNASQKSLLAAACTRFSLLIPTLPTTEFNPCLHIPLVPYVSGRQHGAGKRAYSLGPELFISLLCYPEALTKQHRHPVHPPLAATLCFIDDELITSFIGLLLMDSGLLSPF